MVSNIVGSILSGISHRGLGLRVKGLTFRV